jgi:hypothetical protein
MRFKNVFEGDDTDIGHKNSIEYMIVEQKLIELLKNREVLNNFDKQLFDL